MIKDENEAYQFMFVGIDRYVDTMISTMKFRRIEKGYSQRDLAKITGIKQSALARMEAKKICPRLDTVLVICRALGLHLTFKRMSTGWDKLINIDDQEDK